MTRLSTLSALALSLFSLAVPQSLIANDGRIIALKGAVTVNGSAVTLRTRIRTGDTIETGPKATVRLMMSDSSMIDLRSRTQFEVEDFQYKKEEPSKARSFFNLLRGTFRIVTGAVSKLGSKRLRVSAGTATIGIRGSFQEISFTDVGVSVLSASGTATITLPNSPPVTVGAGSVGSLNIQTGRSSLAAAQSTDPVISAVLAVRDAAPEDRAQQLATALANDGITDGQRAVLVAATVANAADLGLTDAQLLQAVSQAAQTNPQSAAMAVFIIARIKPASFADQAAQQASDAITDPTIKANIDSANDSGKANAGPPAGTGQDQNPSQDSTQEAVEGEDTAENPSVSSATVVE
jgi:hypothetical protein